MPARPEVVAFDVIETVFSLDSLGARITAAGLPESALRLFFAQMLRDAFALEASGVYKPFREIASGSLEVILATQGAPGGRSAIDQVLSGFGELSPHSDVEPALDRLREAGVRVIALTNGSAENTRKLFARARLDSYLERFVSIDEVRRWKPHREVYLHAARVCGVAPERLALVAAHAWDVHGAKQAGLCAAWVKRQDRSFQPAMTAPDVEGGNLLEVISALLSLPA